MTRPGAAPIAAAVAGMAAVAVVVAMFATAVFWVVVAGPAAAAEQLIHDCAGAQPATGDWRPPFDSRYALDPASDPAPASAADGGTGPQLGAGLGDHGAASKAPSGADLVSLPKPATVVAIGAGTVTQAERRGASGVVVQIQHAGGVVSRYEHLASLSVRPGQHLLGGTPLGTEGSSGVSDHPHLHLEILVGHGPVDPAALLADRGAPLDGQPLLAGATSGPAAGSLEGGVGFALPAADQHDLREARTTTAAAIPAAVKALYVVAASRYELPWTLLAGVGMEETRHGHDTATSSAGAQGLMQFMPATFAGFGVDGDGDGRAVITDEADSIFTAANYLTRSGATRGPEGVRAALLTYNQASWYANDVLDYAAQYGGGTVLSDRSSCGEGQSGDTNAQGDPTLPPLTSSRARTVLVWADGHAGDRYIMGANGPDAWDCSSFARGAFRQIGITMPRTAETQRDWLAHGNGFRVEPGHEQPGDLVFWDSYRGPDHIGHVMLVQNPATKSTIEAHDTRDGVGYFSYASGPSHHIFEIWRLGNMTDHLSAAAA